ncbi:holin-like protein [Micromonospora pallida]|uniref:Holin-like protein n=1 Tax=Micromonospora pallida TaxID=145854 RepID=A0A1C6SIS9_9ACTN|nr:CidA/LrgA family protein [Micromonospora pallida]SCL29272.1 holin-like protein [Micromonospora pallida]
MSQDPPAGPAPVTRGLLGFTILYGLYALGTLATSLIGWSVPGAVIGLVMLLAMLQTPWGAHIEQWVGGVGTILVGLLPFLLVPVAAGIVTEADALAAEWVGSAVTVMAGWFVAILVTTLVARWSLGRGRR